jgi:murein DD-endopeptidase MepM/ murein hydrolase activator NlpD
VLALQVTGRARIRVLFIVGLVIAGFAVLLWARRRPELSASEPNDTESVCSSGLKSTASITPAPPSPPTQSPANLAQAATSTLAVSPTPNDSAFAGVLVFTPPLIIPVVGVKPDQLRDTFADARSEGRLHDAIDILAPSGTPVVAAADGEIVKLFQSDRGGTTIYQLSPDKKLIFYYAHLQGYAEGLAVGKFAKQGEVIGYVGDTGNAGAGNFHLHFSVSIIADPKRYWEGTNIDPYPLLHK